MCFQKASEGGGEFLIADGAKILEDMDKDVLERIYKNKVRISVSNLDLNFLGSLPDGFRESASDFFQDLILKVVAPKFDMDLEMIYGADQSNPYRLQAIEHAQSPINKHPVTGAGWAKVVFWVFGVLCEWNDPLKLSLIDMIRM